MRSPPMRLEWYIASSASLMISSDSCVCGSLSARPIEAVRKISRSLKAIGARMVLRMVSAKAVMRAESCSDIRIRPNWSPASRASVSCGLRMRVSHRAEAVDEQFAVRQAGEVVMHAVVQHPLFGILGLGDISQGADHARHFAVG